MSGPAAPPDERMLASVLFVDLAESTALGEQLDVERVRAILEEYFGLVSSTVQAWGGVIEKYIGDAAVALFGVPRVREDDAARAVSAAAEIVERFAAIAAALEARHGVSLAIRVAVNTGEVLAPSVLDPDRPLVTGDAVNVAARLQNEAALGSVLVGERTYQATRGLFRYGEARSLQLKGKREPVVARPLLGRIGGAVESGPVRTIRAGVVGRTHELDALAALLDETLATGRPRLAILSGPAGIGKSRLAREAVELGRARHGDLALHRGRCPSVGQSITFWGLAEIVRSVAGMSLADEGPIGVRKLHELGARLAAAGLPDDDVAATLFALATTAGLQLPQNPLDVSRPMAVLAELERRWPQFLSTLATEAPLVMLLEDLHWASEPLLGVLDAIATRTTGPVFVLVTTRPEHLELPAADEATTIRLRPLEAAESSALLAGLLPDHALSPELQRQILETADGNPLFVEEIVSHLVEAGSVNRDSGQWRSTTGTALPIPDTIYGLLASRIDALPDDERLVCREAAVVGRIFWSEPVATALPNLEITGPLRSLERRGLITLRPTSSISGQVEYAFKHVLIRDVAYGGLSIGRRARAHAAVAAWLARMSPERPEELADLVAFHYQEALGADSDLAWRSSPDELAVVRRDARTAFLIAGPTARKRAAVDRAAELDQLALDLSTTDEERAVALEALGDDYDALYDGDRALPAWDEAIALHRSIGMDPDATARIAMKVARIAAIRWGGFTVAVRPEVIDRYLDEGLAAATEEGTRARLQTLRAAVGLRWVAFHLEDPISLDDRVKGGREGLDYARKIGDPDLETMALRQISGLLMARGQVDVALPMIRELIAKAPRVSDTRNRHLNIVESAQALAWIGGDAPGLLPTLAAALVLARELRVHDICHSTETLMSASYLAGRWDEIEPILEEHRRVFKSDAAGTTCPFALGGFQLGALVLAQRGEIDRAREVAAEMPEPQSPVGIVQGYEAMLANALGDPATGRQIAESVLATGARDFSEEPPVELVAELDALVALGDWTALETFLESARPRRSQLAIAGPAMDRAEGLLAWSNGDGATARELLRRAVAGFDPLFAFAAARAREDLASIDPENRASLLKAASETYERLGAQPSAARVRALLSA